MFKLTSSYPPAREEERVGASAQGPFCRDPLDPVDPLETLAWGKVVFRLSKTIVFRQQKKATRVECDTSLCL